MKIYVPAYDNGMAWEDHYILYSKNAYKSYVEAEKEILSRDMKLNVTRSNSWDDGRKYYEVDIEKARQTHEQYYIDNPEEGYEPFYDDTPELYLESAYIVTLNLEDKFNSNQFTEDGEWFM